LHRHTTTVAHIERHSNSTLAQACPQSHSPEPSRLSRRGATERYNGTRRTFRHSCRLSDSSTGEVLLARPTAEPLDNCHAGNSRNNIGNQCAVHGNTRSHGIRNTLDHALRCHSRHTGYNLHHHRNRLHCATETTPSHHDATILYPPRPLHSRNYRNRDTTLRRTKYQQPMQHIRL